MTVVRDLEVRFDERALQAVHVHGFARPALRPRLAALLEEAQELAAPAATYEMLPIEAVLHGSLRLAGGARVGGGLLAQVVAGAQELVLAVCTIGGALEQRAREHRAEGRIFEMMMLDELGSWAVDQARTALYERVGAELAQRGWRLSSPLAPGESDWPIRDQRKIFRLLDVAQIGVELGRADVMSPLKSISLAFGAGDAPMGAEGLTTCELCSIVDRCGHAAARIATTG